MENNFEELRRELRGLKERIAENRKFLQAKVEELESLIFSNSITNSKLQGRIKQIESRLKIFAGLARPRPDFLDRFKRIESKLKVSRELDSKTPPNKPGR